MASKAKLRKRIARLEGRIENQARGAVATRAKLRMLLDHPDMTPALAGRIKSQFFLLEMADNILKEIYAPRIKEQLSASLPIYTSIRTRVEGGGGAGAGERGPAVDEAPADLAPSEPQV